MIRILLFLFAGSSQTNAEKLLIASKKSIRMKNRTIAESAIKKSKSRFGRIIVITGARQTGKTTLVKNLFPDTPYISIEDPVTVEEYKRLTSLQWNSLFPNAIVDEIQKEPQIVESIKSVYDQFPEPRYVLLGSSQILLLKKIRESLAGRCQIIELFPLTIPELLTHSWREKVELSCFQKLISGISIKNLPFLLDKDHPKKLEVFKTYLKFGGYPALSAREISEEEKYDWLRNYVKTYLERDIRDLVELNRLEPFTRVQKMVALNTAGLTNYSKIAAEAGVSSKTVQRFIEYMNISYQVLILQPWSRNEKKRLVKSPKFHFLDVGVMRTILQNKGELEGQQFESAIISEIYKQLKYVKPDASCYHLRTTDGREVDLLIETEEGYIAIEIKKSQNIRAVDGKHLIGLEEILNKPVLHRLIVSNDLNTKDLGNGLLAIPAVQFLS